MNILERHVFLKWFAVLCLLLLATCFIYADNVTFDSDLHPHHITLTLSGDPKTTQTVTWCTNLTVQNGIIEYKPTSSKSYIRVNATPSLLKTDLGEVRLFTIKLTGLEPGTRYQYHVGDGSYWSGYSEFSTEKANQNSFKFLIFGDSQSGSEEEPNYKPWHDNIKAAFSANGDAKFFINIGDLVEIGESFQHWKNWFDAAAGVIDHIPAMPAEGNHETYLPNTNEDSSKPNIWMRQFPLPDNGPQGLKNQVYSFDYGMVHFIMLDSQEDEEGPKFGSIIEAQKQWLEKDLAGTKQPWKLVFFHKTPYYNKASRTNEIIKAAFCPIFDKYHVDIVFNGHDHGISRTYFINNDEYVSKPSQGTLYYVTGRSGNKTYPDLSSKIWNAFFYDPQDQPNYIVAEVNQNVLKIKALKMDGSVIDNYTIDKAADTDLPKSVPPSSAWVRFTKPVLAIYGTILSPTMIKHAPLYQNGLWYVDLNAFACFTGYKVAMTDGEIKITSGDKSYTIPDDQIITDKGISLISVNALQPLGFSGHFSKSTNTIYITK